MIDLVVRMLTVVLGVGFMLFLPRAMFWPERRKPYVLLVLICVEGLVASCLLGVVYAQARGMALQWYGAPLRLVFLAVGWAYLWAARRDYARESV